MNYDKLIEEVCRTAGRSIRTPQDFDFLRTRIYEKTREIISPSTLKRTFGYLHHDVQPSRSTLNILAQYVGYRDYDHFLLASESVSSQSYHVPHHTLCTETLRLGARLRLTWPPNRECLVRHQGESNFIIEEAVNTKLSVGDTFSSMLMICNEPLYLSNLVHHGAAPITYVIGSRDGIMFEKLPVGYKAKTSFERSQEDIEAGRVYRADSVKDLMSAINAD